MLSYIKHWREMTYWRKCYLRENKKLSCHWYKDIMLNMAQESDDTFLSGKIVADFGCGPRNTLGWINTTSLKLGLDVLAEKYLEFDTASYGTVYPIVTENNIALPDNFVDILFTMNALDHVDNLNKICSEITRIIKTDGLLIASFNLNEPFSWTEPQTLTEEKLKSTLLNNFNIISERRAAFSNSGKAYDNFNKDLPVDVQKPYIYWVKAQKK
jgi:SAM-dependent methyltransferase